MKSLSKSKYFGLIIVIAAVLLSVLVLFIVNRLTLSAPLENDVEVQPDTELTYYLHVNYDGVDKSGVESNDSTTAEIRSGFIFVEDKIPEGLTFKGFVTTSDGSIGAYERSDDSKSCLGKVYDDTNEETLDTGTWNSGNTEYYYHGLHYNADTRTVSFKVKNLKAGCQLTVGIVTQTPATIDDPETTEVETRRDFYNFGTAKENSLNTNSNTVHVFMGKSDITLYEVKYEYTGDVPENAPNVPTTSIYGENAKVGVAPTVKLQGYDFNGWSTTDVTVSNNKFKMPTRNVTLKGNFTATSDSKNKVTYTINGETPENYVLPKEKEYYQDESVSVDSMEVGTVIDGYKFLGWTTTDVTVSDGEFIMPNSDVIFVGRFEEMKYKVEYQFYDGILPPNSESLLPTTKEYKPGVTVALEEPGTANGYKFLGWYKEDNFKMPEEDTIIYGEWKVLAGTFEPTITKEVVDRKSIYSTGDEVTFKITITNNENFDLTDVIVKENDEMAVIIEGTGYEKTTDHFATIPTLAANSSVDVYAKYTLTSTDTTIENEAEIKGALASNGYELADKEYKATASVSKSPSIKVCKNVTGGDTGASFQFKLTNEDNTYETYITLQKDECKTVYVEVGKYKVKEILPQEYRLSSVSGAVTSDNATITTQSGVEYTVTYTNEFVKKGFLHSSGSIVNSIDAN